jgi:hypothetical protein
VELLEIPGALNELCGQVRAARESVEAVIKGGFAVVYALRVEPHWFGDLWARYEYNWQDGRSAVELRCRRNLITPDRIAARVVYPNGTVGFSVRWLQDMEEVEALLESEQNRWAT